MIINKFKQKIEREYELKFNKYKVRADLMSVVRINGKLVPLLIEVDLSPTRVEHTSKKLTVMAQMAQMLITLLTPTK